MDSLIIRKLLPEIRILEEHLNKYIFADERKLYPYSNAYVQYFERGNSLLQELKERDGAIFKNIKAIPSPMPVKMNEYDSDEYLEKDTFRPLLENVERCLTLINANLPIKSPRQTESNSGSALYAFISYHNSDKLIAGQFKEAFELLGIDAFLAHEDITVSVEWAQKILAEIAKANLFVCILTERYQKSDWCMQESGIAAFVGNMTVMPFSLDGTIPQGFIAKYQAVKPGDTILKNDIIPGLIMHDFNMGIAMAINTIKESGSFRRAEMNFELVLPHLGELSDTHAKTLLLVCRENAQVHHASLCANKYIPQILEKHGHLLEKADYSFLSDIVDQYKT
ncbi:MAG: toll/interleukin-1 receptor domain-containing protein [Elusimicrobiota bacterium]|nr:toll/interleukin-1 receptor domain-containing protein [Elusimicrobiota bacterium]